MVVYFREEGGIDRVRELNNAKLYSLSGMRLSLSLSLSLSLYFCGQKVFQR